ncbi:MAG TPA: hypothetical protein VFP54_12695 [Acidimicrobiales bacterium]|nr:hypothetical protein [Acidimicrobiales bacterium]
MPPAVGSIVDVLLPNCTDAALDEIANTTFIDAGVPVTVTGVDQMLAALTRRLLAERALGGVAVVQLPRCRHRGALLLTVSCHLLCRQQPRTLTGPAVLVGFDVDLADQLRTLSVRNYRQMGLYSGNPLRAHRLTRDGSIDPIVGERSNVNGALVYYNTRIGAPAISTAAPLAVIDATSIAGPDGRARALRWAADAGAAATVIVADLGDDSVTDLVTSLGHVPLIVTVTDTEAADLLATLGPVPSVHSTLSSAHLLGWATPPVIVHPVGGTDLNEHVSRAWAALAHKPGGPLPGEVDLCARLLRNGTRLAARVDAYRSACTNNSRPGESPSRAVLRRLAGTHLRGEGAWRPWATGRWGALHHSVLALWEILEADNPKIAALWRTLEDVTRATEGEVLIRCHSRAGAEATLATLRDGPHTPAQEELWAKVCDRVTVATFKERYPARSFAVQILIGAPPPWLFSLFVGAEAAETHVLAYDAEAEVLRYAGNRWAVQLNGWRDAAARTLGAAPLPPLASPIPDPNPDPAARPAGWRSRPERETPDLSLAGVLDQAASVLDHLEDPSSSGRAVGPGARACFPVHLDNGRTWYCINEGNGDTPVLTIGAGGHSFKPVGQLRAGDRIVVPAGDGTESVHARLLALSRANTDVATLDALLTQFRNAARAVMLRYTPKSAAIEKVLDAGAQARELEAWAKGTTIAPREPGDVAAVFKAAGQTAPDLGLIYSVAGQLRKLSGLLKSFAAAITAGRGDAVAGRLRTLIGTAADEILDEYLVATVVAVDAHVTVSSTVAGRLR